MQIDIMGANCFLYVFLTLSCAWSSASVTVFSAIEYSIYGKRLVSSTFHSVGYVGPGMCVEECLRRRSQCKSVNYNKEKLSCELNTANKLTGDITLVDDIKSIFINVTEDVQSNQINHNCSTTMCGQHGVCTETINGSTVCLKEQFIDCAELKQQGAMVDGFYTITPQTNIYKYTYCDMTIHGGGWTVNLLRTPSMRLNFHRKWSEYKAGFSDPISREYWLGNDVLHLLTKNRLSEVYFHMQVQNSVWYWAKYTNFYILGESNQYRIYFDRSSYTGNAGESLTRSSGQAGDIYGQRFATYDYDVYTCAASNRGGWWNRGCSYTYLTRTSPWWTGLSTITYTKMMIRAYT